MHGEAMRLTDFGVACLRGVDVYVLCELQNIGGGLVNMVWVQLGTWSAGDEQHYAAAASRACAEESVQHVEDSQPCSGWITHGGRSSLHWIVLVQDSNIFASVVGSSWGRHASR